MSALKKRPSVANHFSRSVFDGERILTREQNTKLIKASAAALGKARKTGTDVNPEAQTLKRVLERAEISPHILNRLTPLQ
jgi:hypothetical protein